MKTVYVETDIPFALVLLLIRGCELKRGQPLPQILDWPFCFTDINLYLLLICLIGKRVGDERVYVAEGQKSKSKITGLLFLITLERFRLLAFVSRAYLCAKFFRL